MAVESRELKFIATEEKGEVSALYARPRGAKALLVLGHGSGTNMRHRFIKQPVKPSPFRCGSHGEGLLVLWCGALALGISLKAIWAVERCTSAPALHHCDSSVNSTKNSLTKYARKYIFLLCLSPLNTDCAQRKSKRKSCWHILKNVACYITSLSVRESKHGKRIKKVCLVMNRPKQYHC